jgi:UDP-N-acetylglucosamine 4,6-dehydratase
MKSAFEGKSILVTGGTGSIGSEIVREVLKFQPRVVRALSNDENSLFELQQELQMSPNVRLLLGDIRDRERLRRAIEGIDFVFHAAALKHVPLCEYNPFEAAKTNVLGTQNVIDVAIEAGVRKMVTISTDKAVNPANVLGATKLLAERLAISANQYVGSHGTVFSCVRFGNVIGSRGSVVPLFQHQIERGGPVTITEGDMTRFVMSIRLAVSLVLKAAEMSAGGEIYIFKMPTVRILDLAEVMIEELAPRFGYRPAEIIVQVCGRRHGEKQHEHLLTDDEAAVAVETEDMFILYPAGAGKQGRPVPRSAYSSNDAKPLTKAEIKSLVLAD